MKSLRLAMLAVMLQAPNPIPAPPPITLDTLKATLADTLLERNNCQAHRVDLIARISELAAENQKLKDELARAKPAETKEDVK